MGVGALQIVLDKGQEEDWFASHWITALGVVAVAGIAIFVIHEIRARDPVVHLRVFKERTYSAGVFLMTVLGFVLYGSMLLLPIFLQTLLGYPALDAGIAMAPRGLGSFLMMPVVGTVLGRFDPRKVLAVGLVGAAWTLYALSRLNLNAGYWDIFWPQFIQGASLAMLFVPLTTATMDPIPREEMGNATSMFNLMRNIGGSMGIASATTFLFRRQQLHTHLLAADVNPYNPQTQVFLKGVESAMIAHGSDPHTAVSQSYGAIWGMVERQASMLAFVDTFLAMAVVFLLMLPLLFIMKRPRTSPRRRGDALKHEPSRAGPGRLQGSTYLNGLDLDLVSAQSAFDGGHRLIVLRVRVLRPISAAVVFLPCLGCLPIAIGIQLQHFPGSLNGERCGPGCWDAGFNFLFIIRLSDATCVEQFPGEGLRVCQRSREDQNRAQCADFSHSLPSLWVLFEMHTTLHLSFQCMPFSRLPARARFGSAELGKNYQARRSFASVRNGTEHSRRQIRYHGG